jgi:hypothetical protein
LSFPLIPHTALAPSPVLTPLGLRHRARPMFCCLLVVLHGSWMLSGRRARLSHAYSMSAARHDKLNARTSKQALKLQDPSSSKSFKLSSKPTLTAKLCKLKPSSFKALLYPVNCTTLYLEIPLRASRNHQVTKLVFSWSLGVPMTLTVAQGTYPSLFHSRALTYIFVSFK